MDVSIIETTETGEKDFKDVKRSDVVILPAFGASVGELTTLKDLEVQIVDTTCPWVSKVLSPGPSIGHLLHFSDGTGYYVGKPALHNLLGLRSYVAPPVGMPWLLRYDSGASRCVWGSASGECLSWTVLPGLTC